MRQRTNSRNRVETQPDTRWVSSPDEEKARQLSAERKVARWDLKSWKEAFAVKEGFWPVTDDGELKGDDG